MTSEFDHTSPEIQTLQEQNSQKESAELFGVPAGELEQLEIIAKMVGGDFGMKIELGKPGTGSRFDPKENSIQFDPLHIARPEQARMAAFVAAHEGGHRAMTRSPEQIGFSKEQANDLYKKLGFGFGFNALEDPADNNWWSRKYAGLTDTVKTVYDSMFERDAAILGTSEIHSMMAQLGYAPRFAHFGSEIIRYWHTGRFSHGIPDDVRAALEQTKGAMSGFFEDVPDAHATEEERVARAHSRFMTFFDRIWPMMEQLTREDLADERIKKMIEEGMKDGEKGGEGGEGMSIPFDQLPDDLRKELEEKMREASQKAAYAQQEAGDAQAGEKSKDAKDLRAAAKKLRKKGDEKGAAELETQANALDEQAKKESKHTSRPIPMRELSDALRKQLEEMYAKLNQQERRELTRQAQESLEKVEDQLNKELEAKLGATPAPSHEDRHTQERATQDQKALEKELANQARDVRRKIKQEIEKDRTDYDRAYAEVAPLVNLLADDIDRLFMPNRHPRWKGSFPTGGRLMLNKAMQFEARPETYTELWERKTIPHKRDYKFTIAVDLSSSMQGQKIQETFKALILIVEALSRVGIDVEVLGFNKQLFDFKTFDQKMEENVRERLSSIPSKTNEKSAGGTHTGSVVQVVSEHLKQQTAKEKFLIVLTDGMPFPKGQPELLRAVIERLGEEKEIKMIGVGIGSDTEHVRDFWPNALVSPDVPQLPRELAGLLEKMLANPDLF